MIYTREETRRNMEKFEAAVAVIVESLKPELVGLSYSFGEDFSGDDSIFFKCLLSDASVGRLQAVAEKVHGRFTSHFDFPESGLHPYFNFRSESEQRKAKDRDWPSAPEEAA